MKLRDFMLVIGVMIISLVAFSTAEYSIDISGLQSAEYMIGEDILFTVILLEDSNILLGEVEVVLNDALQKKEIVKTINSNEEEGVLVESDFRSGLWEITETYNDVEVTRTFSVGENSDIEFLIEGDELVIRNNGNTAYTKTIQIKIGDEINSYKQNIGVGGEKRLKVVSPEGFYDIEVTDGEVTLKKENIQLFGTGNVIGAVDPDLVGYTGFAGATDPSNLENNAASKEKYSFTMIFVVAVLVIGALVFVERRMAKGKGKKSKKKVKSRK
ncbi:hypothetical protein HN604_00895 [archaeon]|jgi:hypothetical protein|nr:hypothetical protein [archaeon]MBT6182705.1 hypothetical protein [archaeon]MBT6606698.1 hypothetical protein [archaeon]MBT7251941.1 hypothetical protein [archaeon]MBT7660620.1 hypothetical protein [archaeon]